MWLLEEENGGYRCPALLSRPREELAPSHLLPEDHTLLPTQQSTLSSPYWNEDLDIPLVA